jgi:iron complex transport system ATP-binding protein
MKIFDVKLSYANKTILDKISFEIKGHQHLSVLGPNGGGKSTLAKALCGLISYQGSIKIDDEELSTIPSKERAKRISYIPAKMESFEQFTTVEDFVLLGRYPYKSSFKDYTQDDKIIVQDILKELNIQELSTHKIHELSSGQQQLILISQALAQQSQILIFDEPTSNLDPKNTSLFVKELKKLRQKHMTILITHDIQLASHLNDPVLFIHEKKAKLYEEGFFEKEYLNLAYDVNFKNENGLIGIDYA